METKKFEFTSKVRYSEVDATQKISVPAIINYFQDCSTFHSESIGWGTERIYEMGHAWILSSWNIEILKYPKLMEDIVISTWPTGFKSFMGDRNFTLSDKNGEIVARASSLWVYMDFIHGRPIKPPKEEMDAYGCGEPLQMEKPPRKMHFPEGGQQCPPMLVRKFQIDTNHHMNNCQYILDALEIADSSKTVKGIKVEYKKSAMLGDTICPTIIREEDKDLLKLANEDGEIYAIVELLYEA